MKKIIVLLMALAMSVSLVACGNNNQGSDNGENPSQTQDATIPATEAATTGGQKDTYDLTTTEGYIAQFGYTVDDFKFTKDFTRVGYASRMVRGDVLYVSEAAVFQSARKSAEEKQKWLEDFVELTKTKSDDGKVYGYSIFDGVSSEEYVAQYDPDVFVYITYMAYNLNGKTVTVRVCFSNGLDNEDPEEADYLVSIEFEFMKTY